MPLEGERRPKAGVGLVLQNPLEGSWTRRPFGNATYRASYTLKTFYKKSAKNRLEIFEHTGVTTQEYDITIPCGIRREALPIRHDINRAGTPALHQREKQIVRLRREQDLTNLTRTREKADRKQCLTKQIRQRKGGGVRESMLKDSLSARNKDKWTAMCKRIDRTNHTHKTKAGEEEEGDNTQNKNQRDGKNDLSGDTPLKLQKCNDTKHKPPPTT